MFTVGSSIKFCIWYSTYNAPETRDRAKSFSVELDFLEQAANILSDSKLNRKQNQIFNVVQGSWFPIINCTANLIPSWVATIGKDPTFLERHSFMRWLPVAPLTDIFFVIRRRLEPPISSSRVCSHSLLRYGRWCWTDSHRHNHVEYPIWIRLTCPLYPSLSGMAPGRSSRWYPQSSTSWSV